MEENKGFPQDIIKAILAAIAGRVYGSVEIYFEDGKVTQITQRIIKKINRNRDVNNSSSIKFTT